MSNQAPKMSPRSIETEQSVLDTLPRDKNAGAATLSEESKASPRLEQLAEARMRAERSQK